ncbi:MAG: CoA transferase [Candidatus Wallbacteria bacterium]|nr:CoA transferase [Candidatus Wallbacteria bacterium]
MKPDGTGAPGRGARSEAPRGPLVGIRVLDLTRALAGPYCTMMLADLGAEVIKVETPGKGDDTRGWGPPFEGGEASYYLSCNRNKKSITLNLKSARGREILLELARRSDVMVENSRPGAMEALGLGYSDVCKVAPGIVYCTITGFGASGPDRDRPGYDLIAQGMGGFMGFTGEKGGGPLKVGVAVGDINAGMFSAFGILAALFHRARTGQGQRVDTSLLEGQVAQLTYQAGRYFATGESPTPLGNDHPTIVPYASYRAKDGAINIAVGSEALWKAFCEALGRGDLQADPRFATNRDRVAHREELTRLLEEMFAGMNVAAIRGALDRAGVPNGPILPLAQVLTHPQVLARDMVVELEHQKAGAIRVTGLPVKLSETPGGIHSAPPLLGEHTQQVLRELLELDSERIAELSREGVV